MRKQLAPSSIVYSDLAYEIEWPKIIVHKTLHEPTSSDRLTVMHIALRGIIAQYSINHDHFFSRSEPEKQHVALTTENAREKK